MRKFLTSMGMALAVTFAAPAVAAAPAVISPVFEYAGATADPGGDEPANTIGFSFTLTQPTSVNALGYWNGSAPGDYLVGIWDSSGTPLNVTSVTIGGPSQSAHYTFTSIAPLLLAAGSYVIGGQYAGGSFPYALTGLTTAPGYVYNGIRESEAGSGFTFPTSAFPDSQRFFGTQSFALVNFSIVQISAVPEPATWAMMLLGFGVVGTSIRRRRKVLAAA